MRTRTPRTSRRRRSQRGSSIVEFALVWSLLWLLFAGVYQLGYSFYVYNKLLTAVADAADLGSKIPFDISTSGSASVAKVKNYVVYGAPTGGSTSVAPGLTSANVAVSFATDAQGVPRDITVLIQNYSIDAIFAKFAMNGKPRATMLYMGQVNCTGC